MCLDAIDNARTRLVEAVELPSMWVWAVKLALACCGVSHLPRARCKTPTIFLMIR